MVNHAFSAVLPIDGGTRAERPFIFPGCSVRRQLKMNAITALSRNNISLK
jgi:hypothetical protein